MLVVIENECLRVEINTLGAELWSVYDRRRDRQLLWQGDAAVWPRCSPLLFPICGRRSDGSLPLHGFIRDYEHTAAEQTAQRVVLRCLPCDETRARYPHDFIFSTEYALVGDTLTCALLIENPGATPLPFSVGFHSGFFAAPGATLRFEQAEHCARLLCDDDGFSAGRTGDFMAGRQTLSLDGADFPSTVLLESPRSHYVDLISGGETVLRLGFEGFPTLAVWVKELPLRFVCIEPWHAIPEPQGTVGPLSDKPGVRLLPPGEQFRCAQTVTPR